MKASFAVAAAVVVTGCGVLCAAAGTQTFQVPERLNRAWSEEFVAFPVQFPNGACHPDSLLLTDEDGTTVPHQLADTVPWKGDGHVREAQLAFVVDRLPPLETRTYVLAFGPKAREDAVAPADGLGVEETETGWQVSTPAFGVRVPRAEQTFEAPVPLAGLAPPVSAFRLADGTWFGSAAFEGDARVASWRSELTAAGPVFAESRTVYHLDDGAELAYRVRLVRGDYAVRMTARSSVDHPELTLAVDLSRDLALHDAVLVPGVGRYAAEREVALEGDGQEPLFYLSCWTGDGWFQDAPTALSLRLRDRDEALQLSVAQPGAWVEPDRDAFWTDFQPWDYEQMPQMWDGWQRKRIPFVVGPRGRVTMRVDAAQGDRVWTLGATARPGLLLERFKGSHMSVHSALPRLDAVKDMVLSWKSERRAHPWLMIDSPRALEQAGGFDRAALQMATDLDALRKELNTLGCFDPMRSPKPLAYLYDGAIEKAEPAERDLLKAQMAYTGYLLRSPLYWSFERGQNSGNPNMTVSRTVNVGLFGCVLLDHPEGKDWAQYAIDWIDDWLGHTLDEQGVWIESSHYARYALSCMTLMAIAARNRGLHDFFGDPRFKKALTYYEESMTPPDPLRHVNSARLQTFRLPAPAVRCDPTYGRGTRADTWPTAGLAARATATTDPAFSRIMQWSWRGCGYVDWFGGKTSGHSSLYMSPYLPVEVPSWRSRRFLNRGYLLRSHVGSPRENYLYFITEYYRSADGEIWPSNTGSIVKWFAGGVPIGGSFVRMYKSSYPLLENRVLLATNWTPGREDAPSSGYVTETDHRGSALLPAADFAHVRFTVPAIKEHIMKMDPSAPAFPVREREGELPLVWDRQVLLTKPGSADGPSYLVLRDTVTGDTPTQWHFWTLSNGVEPADQAGGAEPLGPEPAPLRELAGDRFTALGQFGVDCEYYVAAPTKTPRYTLRHGSRQGGYGLGHNIPEYQDLLHLQLPAAGAYFVCLFPTPEGEDAPAFETLCEGTVIRVRSRALEDYAFLCAAERTVSHGPVAFTGTAASVQVRPEGLRLSLGAPGQAAFAGWSVRAAAPVALVGSPGWVTVTRAEAGAEMDVRFTAPAVPALPAGTEGVKLQAEDAGWRLTLAPGVMSCALSLGSTL